MSVKTRGAASVAGPKSSARWASAPAARSVACPGGLRHRRERRRDGPRRLRETPSALSAGIRGTGRVMDEPREEEPRRRAWRRPESRTREPSCGRSRTRYLRLRADFENYRRRVERDRDVAARQGKRDLLMALVDLADGFDRALAHVDDSPDSVAAGLGGMHRRLDSLLEAEGVRSFESVGQPFDPTRHEAVATVRDGGDAPGTVVDEDRPRLHVERRAPPPRPGEGRGIEGNHHASPKGRPSSSSVWSAGRRGGLARPPVSRLRRKRPRSASPRWSGATSRPSSRRPGRSMPSRR